jgi:hypothetical protein
MTKVQSIDDADLIAEFERAFDLEARNIKRLLKEICASKLFRVSIVETKGENSDTDPMLITLRIDPPNFEAKGADRASYH